ncbi:PREDICTED: kinetochore-associated protein 1 [Eufriesea mexicana]|uniref:kinetochore-associated protein 1 n=1 Tax=Eufriesea mexicana TaxID=516756 RepID=UPI00083C907B|nr:PREDICTED: kinetochore-associated protein 1 [Eufriesea mexicana]
MALWNKVVSGFDKEEETVNFGTRIIAENNGLLYETFTVATIQSDGKVTKEPNILASVQYSRVCIAIDKSITIFENETCEKILLSINFELLISCYCISHNGIFLFVVLSNGILYCLHLLKKGQVIFTKNITKTENKVIKIFLQNESDECINIYLITRNGTLYRISLFNVKAIHCAIINEVNINNILKELTDKVECIQLFKGFSYDEVVYATANVTYNEISIAMLCSNMLFIWPSEQYINFDTLHYTYTKLKFFKNYIAMLCLRTDHILSLVCPQTLLGIKVYSKAVSDFEIIENNDNSLCQILVLTSDTNSIICTLRVLSYPDFQEKFQINIPVMTYFVEIMDPYDEIILYLEGVNGLNSDTKNIDTVRVKTVLESDPEYQLQRLIRKEQFDTAETFANKFNLSTDPIYCAKSAIMLSQFGPWAKKYSSPIQLDMLFNMFDKVKDVQYVVECCSKALIPDYKQMRKINLYARSRIIETNTKDDKYLCLLSSINDILHKLETFHMIWGYQKNLEYYDEDTMKEWIRFSRANFMEEYRTHLSLGEMEAATLIWTRHLPSIKKYLSIKIIKDIFAIVPENISLHTLWAWLTHFIPTLLSLIPNAVCEIILWGCKKVKSFEQSHRSEWPQIGIDFMKKFINLLKFEGSHHQSLHFQQECLNKDSNLKQLVFLMQAMSDIQKLKINYRLAISLKLYIGDPMEVSYILLDKIHIDIILKFVNSFLKQYMLNNSLKNDYVFSSYIQKILRNSKSWWSSDEAPWEEKIVIIIDLIENIETKLQQTLEVLKKASVPWSSTILSLVETSYNFDHILTSKIKIEHNCVSIKLILKKYGYERIGINSKLVHFIIKKNYDSMISDIQQITKNDSLLRKKAFSSCVNYYLIRGNFENVTKALNSVEDDVLLYCCVQIINYTIASVTLKIIPEYLTYYVEMFGWVKLHLKKLLRKYKIQSYYYNNVINNINEIKSIYFLKKDFQINVSLEEYQLKKRQILQNYVEKLCVVNIEEDEELFVISKKVIKVANLLKLQKIEAVSLLLEWTKNLHLLNCFIGCKEEKLNILTDECQYVYKICLFIMQHFKMNADVVITIQKLCSAALCECLDDELQSILLLYTWINLYQEWYNKNLRYDLNSVDMKHEEIPRSNWKLYTIYKDLSISTDEFLLPLLRNVISAQKFYVARSKFVTEYVTTDATDQDYNWENTEGPLKDLLDKIKILKMEHNDYCLLQIIKTLYFSFCAIPNIRGILLTEIKSVYFHLLTILLKKVISSREFDLQLSLSCLFMLSNAEACKWISSTCKSFQTDYTRHLRITILGYEYFHLTENQILLQTFKNNKILHYWAQKLSKYSVSYKEILISDATAKRQILQRIMNYDDNMVPLFQEFCSDFGFDIQDCLLLYLQTVIKTWNPKLNINNYNGKKELYINEEEVNELRKKCNTIATYIFDKVALKNCVTTIFSQINFYHYEIFIILMDLIEDKNIEHRNYFCFLQNYTRIGPPTQIEYDEWLHLNPGYTSLPPIAKWRLPFLPKVELWKLITPELNLKTYDKWLGIAPILKLQPHIICTLAIKGEVTHVWKDKHKTTKWTLCSKNNSLLNNIKKCIERMSDSDRLYYGTAALYYVVNHTPPGADQVAAVEECYKYAQLSAQRSTMFEEGMLEKIKFKYLRFTSEHILHTYGLGNKNYLSLIGNPNKLICELYADESIPQRYQCVIDHRPDINSAVSSISQLLSINIVKLQMELLQEWLEPDIKFIKFNQSITETFPTITNVESNLNCDDNLLRACYILENIDLELSANLLINIGFGDGNEDYSSEARYRALYVLQTLIDTTKLLDFTKRDYQTIRNYMRSLKYIGRLELLGIGYSINTFETCSKHELVQILWKTQNYSPQALVIIAQLCIDFEIYEYSLWDKNLTKLAKLLMINDLKKILLQIRNISTIVNSNGYLLGWEVTISEPFKKMDMSPTSEQIENCIEALRLLYSCPVVHMLSFTDVIKCCFQCQQLHLVLAFLPFLNDDDTIFVLKEIKYISNISKALEDLNNLLLNGILCVAYCNKIMENILKKINI